MMNNVGYKTEKNDSLQNAIYFNIFILTYIIILFKKVTEMYKAK